jgi:hypothetical protein
MYSFNIRRRYSCGCSQRDISTWKSVGAKNITWKLPYGEAAKNDLYSTYRTSANRRGLNFDIDVDLSPLLGRVLGPTLVNAGWYELVQPREGRSPDLQVKLNDSFHKTLLYAQWRATTRRRLDRRRAVRVPMISRVLTPASNRLTSCDISLSGLRCAGRPSMPVMDVEFKIPGQTDSHGR